MSFLMMPGSRNRDPMVIKEYFQFLVPWLLVMLCIVSVCSWTNLCKFTQGWQKLLVLALSAVITLTPIGGLSLADYLLSLNPNFSIGSLALLVVLLWQKFTGQPLLSDMNLWMFCLWNVIISLVLFSSYLGFIPYDMYASGYHFSLWFIIVAAITLIAVWSWNPLSVIFIAYIAAFNLKLLPSPNFFDYITDGFLLLLSLGILFPFLMPTRRLNSSNN
jgi:uncharacterized membrane protein